MFVRRRWRRIVLAALVLLAVGALAAVLIAHGRAEANRLPIVRHALIRFPDLPRDVRPLRLALLSDIHIGNATTPPARLERVVAGINAARPDGILIVGDFVNGEYPGDPAARPDLLTGPLSRLKAPLGAFATLGNHDHWTDADAVRAALEKAGITVLANSAARFGPFALAGIDDSTSGHAKSGLAIEKAARLGGIPIIVTHAPGIESWVPRSMPMMLNGHTHCGQAVLAIGGWTFYPSELIHGRSYPKAMRCGMGETGGMITVVTAGIGTTMLPMRFGAPPDWWLITLAPVSGDTIRAPRRDQRNASAGER